MATSDSRRSGTFAQPGGVTVADDFAAAMPFSSTAPYLLKHLDLDFGEHCLDCHCFRREKQLPRLTQPLYPVLSYTHSVLLDLVRPSNTAIELLFHRRHII